MTADSAWSVSGGPKVSNWWELPGMAGNILTPGVPSATPLMVKASITRNTGRIVSAAFPVTVTESNGMNVGIALVSAAVTGPVYVRTEGSNFVWRIAAEASGLAADQPGVTFQWSLNGAALATGKNLDTEFAGTPGTRDLRVVATDSQSRTGQSYRTLTFDAPPVPSEPPSLIRAVDPVFGEVIDENGNPFAFDPLNIAIFAWGSLSDPTKYWGFDAARDKALDRADSALVGLPILATSFVGGFVADCILVPRTGNPRERNWRIGFARKSIAAIS